MKTMILFCLLGLFAVGDSFSTLADTSCYSSHPTRIRRRRRRRINTPTLSSSAASRTSLLQQQRQASLSPRTIHSMVAQPNGAKEEEQEETLTAEKVASMIEVSFVEGVMQLAQGYVETVKLFIAAVLTGYGMSLPVQDLIQKVKACPVQTANRPLLPEEDVLRSTWIKLIYLAAHFVQYRQGVVKNASALLESINSDNSDDTKDWNVYQTILPRLQQQHALGNETGPRFVSQDIWAQNVDILSSAVTDKALLLQNLRILWMTLTVMEEEKLCTDQQDTEQLPPAPPIPNQLGDDASNA